MKQIINNKKGVTIVEMLFSISLFALSIMAVMEIFVTVVDGQQNAIASRNLQENMRYAFEVMAKELRMARIDGVGSNDVCDDSDPSREIDDYKIYDNDADYDASASFLKFRNYHNECVKYSLENNRIKVERDTASGYLTPDEISISNLSFLVKDKYTGSHPATQGEQSIVTIRMDINTRDTKVRHAQNMKIQTTISSRYY